ncbi:MAG: ABC transporter ATP-binding protein [Candidatus Vecturithrix sp.]|jgi:oligopeptide/dipeptide ABC transporter ATP-binding protein|nr:ABC transporter ATP-binding protein [Candidatus Vecturithrix sp.]
MQKVFEIRHLVKEFPGAGSWFRRKQQTVKAINDVSFDIFQGETFGLVGESGCGKSTTAQLLIRLLEPTSGEIFFQGTNIAELSEKAFNAHRRNIQMIFQDPYAAMNPRMTVKRIISEPLMTHHVDEDRQDERIDELLSLVALSTSYRDRYPHEFSGGQRQRICIARALALNPAFIVADEPVAALDVSIQAQIINLLIDLQTQFQLTMLFITHDLSVAQYICRRIGVMYLGRIVELAQSDTLFESPLHPYTKALISAVPIANPKNRLKLVPLEGEIPSPMNLPPGCTFHPRCPLAEEICQREIPEPVEIDTGHLVACHAVTRAVKK